MHKSAMRIMHKSAMRISVLKKGMRTNMLQKRDENQYAAKEATYTPIPGVVMSAYAAGDTDVYTADDTDAYMVFRAVYVFVVCVLHSL